MGKNAHPRTVNEVIIRVLSVTDLSSQFGINNNLTVNILTVCINYRPLHPVISFSVINYVVI